MGQTGKRWAATATRKRQHRQLNGQPNAKSPGQNGTGLFALGPGCKSPEKADSTVCRANYFAGSAGVVVPAAAAAAAGLAGTLAAAAGAAFVLALAGTAALDLLVSAFNSWSPHRTCKPAAALVTTKGRAGGKWVANPCAHRGAIVATRTGAPPDKALCWHIGASSGPRQLTPDIARAPARGCRAAGQCQ